MKRTLFGFTAAALLVTGSASAAPLVSDDFTYPDGNIVGNGGWAVHSGDTGTDVTVFSGQAVLSHGAGSREDVNLSFAAQTSGVLQATFDLIVTDDAPITGTDFEYFAHFFETGGFNFMSRLDIVAANGSGDYAVGISTDSSTAQATTTADFNFGDTVAVVLEFDFATGIGSATVGGETITGTGISLGETLEAFALRQSNSSSDETITIDNLVVENVPEPSSLALLGLGGLLIARRRRA